MGYFFVVCVSVKENEVVTCHVREGVCGVFCVRGCCKFD